MTDAEPTEEQRAEAKAWWSTWRSVDELAQLVAAAESRGERRGLERAAESADERARFAASRKDGASDPVNTAFVAACQTVAGGLRVLAAKGER